MGLDGCAILIFTHQGAMQVGQHTSFPLVSCKSLAAFSSKLIIC